MTIFQTRQAPQHVARFLKGKEIGLGEAKHHGEEPNIVVAGPANRDLQTAICIAVQKREAIADFKLCIVDWLQRFRRA